MWKIFSYMSRLCVRSHPVGVCPQPVLGAQRSPVVATGIVKEKEHEGAVGTVTAKLATGVRPVASVASATLRQSAMPAIWYVQVGSQRCGTGQGQEGRRPTCPLPPSMFWPLCPLLGT
jgi:hypothetical protein